MTAQHQIIKETTDTLVDLLETTYKDNGYKRVHVLVEAPKPDAIEGKLPAICLYLFQIGPEWDGVPMLSDAYDGVKRMRTPEGRIIEVRERAPNWVRLDYLISTWAQTPEDEQLLLGLAIKCVSETNYLEGEALKGETFPVDFTLPLVTARFEEGTLARFWGSLNQPIRPALQVWTVVPIMSDVVSPFRRVEERVIGYRRLGVRGGERDELELGPERRPDMPPDGVFVERKK